MRKSEVACLSCLLFNMKMFSRLCKIRARGVDVSLIILKPKAVLFLIFFL